MQSSKCNMHTTVYCVGAVVHILLNQDFLRYLQGTFFRKLQHAAMNENLKLADAERHAICGFLHLPARLSTRRSVGTNWLVLFVLWQID